jgi:hypothetical protein
MRAGLSLDHLIGSQQQGLRGRQTSDLGGLEVDDQVEVSRLLDREITWAPLLLQRADQVLR